MHHAAPVAAPQPDCYRIQDLASGLYIRFSCTLAGADARPRVIARLTRRDRASRFTRHAAAAECFARYIGNAPLEIVRCDS